MFFAKWGIWLIVAAVVCIAVVFAVRAYNEGLRDEGRAEIQRKWDADKTARDKETARLVSAARAEERANQKAIQEGKDQADAQREKLAKDYAALELAHGRLRVNRTALCQRQPGVPGGAGNLGGSAQAAGTETLRAGAGEIDLDDVAREVGRLGRDLDAANIRIVELIGIAKVCQAR